MFKVYHFIIREYCFWVIVLFALPSGVLPIFSQSKKDAARKEAGLPFIQNFSPKDYGAGGQNWAIVQDERGVMYFGNGAGVLEYDGVSWRTIPTANKSTVRSLAIDETGRIFAGAQGDFGYLAADEKGQLNYVSLLEKVPEKYRDFADVWETFAVSGGIYFRTSKYLFRWQKTLTDSDSIKAWNQPGITTDFSFAFEDNIYLGWGRRGLWKTAGDTLQKIPGSELLTGDFLMNMLPAPARKDAKSIALTISGAGQLRYFDGASFESVPPALATESSDFFKKSLAFRGTTLADGRFAIGTLRSGVVILDREGRLEQALNRESGLQDEAVYAVYQDREGGLWTAFNNGLARVEVSAPLSRFDETLGLPTNVEKFWRQNGRLYAATGLGVFALAPANGIKSARFEHIPSLSRQVFDLLSVKNNLLAASTEGLFSIGQNRTSEILGLYMFSLHHSTLNPEIVFAGLEQGLAVFQYVKGKWRFDGYFNDVFEQIRTICEETPGILWLGTRNRGYLRLDYRHVVFPPESAPERSKIREGAFFGKIERFGKAEGVAEGMALCYLISGKTFFTTEGGLKRFDEAAKRFVPDSAFGAIFADSLRWISAMDEDSAGNIWIASGIGNIGEAGIISRDEAGNYHYNSRPFDRASEAGVGVNGIYVDPLHEGAVWFGMTEGVLRYSTELDKNNSPKFPALVRQVLVNSDSAIYSGLTPTTFQAKKMRKPVLRYTENAIRFEYAAPSFDNAAQNRYQVFLEGFGQDWSAWTVETRKDYTNLPEGDYQFKVRAKNIYNEQSSEGHFQFTILPPWYRTIWAYLAYTILFFGMAAFAVYTSAKRRTRQLETRAKMLEAIVEERTAEVVAQKNQLENQKEQLVAQAAQLQEMDSVKSRFFANISHEFRTPLTLILGPVRQMLAAADVGRFQTKLRTVERNSQRLVHLINELLDLAKLESGKMKLEAEPGDFLAFINGITAAFSSMAEIRNIDLQVNANNLNEKQLYFYFDHEKLEKVFANLLSNAFKFTPEGGQVLVAVGMPDASKFAKSDSQTIAVSVKDTGSGIPAAELPHIFDRFYQARDENNMTKNGLGTGIGMALTKELIEAHHGSISVESEPGDGTIFTVQLPLRIAEKPRSEKRKAKSEKIEEHRAGVQNPEPETRQPNQQIKKSANQKIILLVEDNPDMRAYICEELLPHFQVKEAFNGREGFEKAVDIVPDLIVSDVMMPEMNGFQLCEKLKTDTRTSHIPVILLTAKAGEESKIEGLETGADDYLVKPFDFRELHVRIKNLIEQRRKLRKRFSKKSIIQPEEVTANSVDKAFLEKAFALVKANVGDENFGLDQLEKELGMSRRQLSRKFRALIDQSPANFILNTRLQCAVEFMKQNAGTVAEIAYMSGFNTPNYFAKCFRKQYGASPSEYMKRLTVNG